MRFRLSLKKAGNIRVAFTAILLLLAFVSVGVLFIANAERKRHTTSTLEQLDRMTALYKRKLNNATSALEDIAASKLTKDIYANKPVNPKDITSLRFALDKYDFKEIFFIGPRGEIILTARHTYPPAPLMEDLSRIQNTTRQPSNMIVYNFSYTFWKGYHIVLREDVLVENRKRGEIWGIIPVESFPVANLPGENFLILNNDVTLGDPRFIPSRTDIENIMKRISLKDVFSYTSTVGKKYIVKSIPPYNWVIAMKQQEDNLLSALVYLFVFLSVLTLGLGFLFYRVDKDYAVFRSFERWIDMVKAKPVDIISLGETPAPDKFSEMVKGVIVDAVAEVEKGMKEKEAYFMETARKLTEKLSNVRANIELLMEALLEPTRSSMSIVSAVGEFTGSSKEIVESAKLAIDVTKDSERNLLTQSKIWKKSAPVLTLIQAKTKELMTELNKLSQLLISSMSVLKGLEDKMWMLFASEPKNPSHISADTLGYQGLFRSLSDLITFLDAIDNTIAKLKSDAESISADLQEFDDEIKEALYHAENLMNIEKRLLGILERLISIADGTTWTVEDLQHNLQNVSSANWEITGQLKSIIAELEKIETELKAVLGIPKEEKVRKAA